MSEQITSGLVSTGLRVPPEKASAIPPGGAPDQEVADLMERLSSLQTWVTLLACKQISGAREAMTLIQDTRCLIVERLYPANLGATING